MLLQKSFFVSYLIPKLQHTESWSEIQSMQSVFIMQVRSFQGLELIEVFKCCFNKWTMRTWKHWPLAPTNGLAKIMITFKQVPQIHGQSNRHQWCCKLDGKLKQTAQIFRRATVFTLFRGNHSTNGLLITVSGYYTGVFLYSLGLMSLEKMKGKKIVLESRLLKKMNGHCCVVLLSL